MKYSSLLSTFAGGVVIILIVLAGFKIMTSDNSKTISWVMSTFNNLCIALILLVGVAPVLLSGSVIATNLINSQIMSISSGDCIGSSGKIKNSQNQDVPAPLSYGTCSLNKILDNLSKDNQVVEIDSWDLGGYIMRFVYIATGYVTSIPQLLLGIIMLILLLVILIQFIARYISLYFLFAIYPIVVVFWAFNGTQHIVRNYVKQIITLLIHQPFFLFGFVILSDLAKNMGSGFDIANILLYIIFLGALSSMPGALAARIFGDVWASNDHSAMYGNNYLVNKAKSQASYRVNQAETLAHNNIYAPIRSPKKFLENKSKSANSSSNTISNSNAFK
jgi:TrbL/VirB6 plasmid conjugal transfer protein